MVDLNKDCVGNSITGVSSNLSNWSYTYSSGCYTGMTLLDKYYKINKKVSTGELPVAAQRDILKLINKKKEIKLQFSIDYLTIDFEEGTPLDVCHVVIKEVLYSYYSTPVISYDTTLPKPIDITCNNTATGSGITCDSPLTVDTSGQMTMQL